MNKEYYNKKIDKEIDYLMEEIDYLRDEILSVATEYEYLDTESNVDLDKYQISAINEKRKMIFALYELIHNLDKLKRKESE